MDQFVARRVPLTAVIPALTAIAAFSGCDKSQIPSAETPTFTITIGGGCGERGPAPDLIGTRPENWQATEWVNSGPLRLEDLRGKVVLVRWFMGSGCPDCSATAAALREFDELYRDAGLAVVGMFIDGELGDDKPSLDDVRGIVKEYGYKFPVAIDRDTITRSTWTQGGDNCGYRDPYRSVTLLLDRRGVVRHAHHEGRYVKGDFAYFEMQSAIERLLLDESRMREQFDRPGDELFTAADRAEVNSLAAASERVSLIQIERFDEERQVVQHDHRIPSGENHNLSRKKGE